MARNSVRVVVRTRPTRNFDDKIFCIDQETAAIDLRPPSKNDVFHFKFDRVLHNASQEQVFDECMRSILSNVLAGYNGTVMVYGQTGAGKTFTMSGGMRSFELRGIIPRAITAIYDEISNRPEIAYTIRISYTEIYTELMFDLLSSTPVVQQSGNELQIQEDAKRGLVVRGLTMRLASSEEEALNHFFEGDMNRAVAGHTLNTQSSRSHCIFSIFIEGKSRVESNDKIVTSKLHLIDLAGCERVKKTKSDGAGLRESSYINKSLSFLEMVVLALGEKRRDHIPYRSSRLTHLLKDSIGGNCHTCMITNIWPEAQYIEETVSTLRFATRMMRVSNRAVINVQIDPVSLLRRYEREIRSLKQELQMQNSLFGRARMGTETFNAEEKDEIRKAVQGFLEGSNDQIEIRSVRQINEIMKTMRDLYKDAVGIRKDGDMRQSLPSAATAGVIPAGLDSPAAESSPASARQRGQHTGCPGQGKEVVTAATSLQRNTPGSQSSVAQKETPVCLPFCCVADVGVEDPYAGGASLGVDPDQSVHARRHMGELEVAANSSQQREKCVADSSTSSPGGSRGSRHMDRKRAYFEFKQGEGKIYEDTFMQIRRELNEKRVAFASIAEKITPLVHTMEELKEKLHQKQERAEGDDLIVVDGEKQRVIDEEEFALMKQLRDTKHAIKTAMLERKNIKLAMTQGEHKIAQCKIELVNAFNAWYSRNFGGEEGGVYALRPCRHRHSADETRLVNVSRSLAVSPLQRSKKATIEEQCSTENLAHNDLLFSTGHWQF